MRNFFSFLLIVSLAFSCSPEEDQNIPAGVLSEEKMTDVLVSLNISESLINHYTIDHKKLPDSLQKKIINPAPVPELKFNVFKENGVKREDYLKSMEYYSQHPAQLKKIYEKVMEKLNLMKQES
ncbi:MAG: DUF4296 domain-containing protein [Bacteroidia bacterium]|nr:DUF4296 domain-containing protein [Bacteroidia bacterium]